MSSNDHPAAPMVYSVSNPLSRGNQLLQYWANLRVHPLFWLLVLGTLSLPVYALVLVHGDFRPGRMEPFFLIFGTAFILYALAVWVILRPAPITQSVNDTSTSKIHKSVIAKLNIANWRLPVIFSFAILFNVILLPSLPNLSDDMFRYVWDGRVQAAGISPYRYASNAPELSYLRDDAIWKRMNRPDAITIYPPGAQLIFALTWRIIPDSIAAFKLVFIAATLLAGWLLVRLLNALGQPPERVLIFLWNPLLIFEIAHAAHVDALYLPLIIGAFIIRAHSVSKGANWRYEVGIGLLLGLATLVKLYPVMLAVCLWSVRDTDGKRRWRIALPITLILTVLVGYAFYIQPGVNVLGFLSKYGKEFFNVSPLIRVLIAFAYTHHIPWYQMANIGMPVLVVVTSLIFIIWPAASARQAILRCLWPIGIYLLINHNLFSWYALWLLPLITLDLQLSKWRSLFKLNSAFAWWVFSGTIALSYTFFLYRKENVTAIGLEFVPIYILLGIALFLSLYPYFKTKRHQS
ncbi:MAG: DUF2029 domain-containing protein [Anaerolineae bacterium]|nr:DUF2029 domain-containing protein [Anaerolineae bacterium]